MNEEEQAIQCAKEQAPADMIFTPVVITGARLHKKMNVTGEDLVVHGKRWYVLVELRNANINDEEYGTAATALYRVWSENGQLRAVRVELYDGGIDELEQDENEYRYPEQQGTSHLLKEGE